MRPAEDMLAFIAAGPSPDHCVAEAARRLQAGGFTEVDERRAPAPLAAGAQQFVRRAGTLVAWRAGTAAIAEAGFRLLGAHTDSPNLRLKPNPDYSRAGYLQWGVEVYGGVLLATWADRDLGVSGRVALRDGDGVRTELVRIDRPIARIPNLAIHLNRKVNDDGLVLNRQRHLPPVIGLGEGEEAGEQLRSLIADASGCEPDDILRWDLGLHDLQAPTIGGLHDEFVFAPRLDNQASCHCALQALLGASAAAATQVVVLYDHEEVGSGSERGAASALLGHLLARLERDHEARAPGGVERAAAASYSISIDMAHAGHPNHLDKHDARHRPRINGGPVIKTNANMRYATDAETAARFRLACEVVGAPVQDFVNRTDLACGSTIGPISAAALGIRTVDVGGAMLSMHSIREQAGTRDVAWMIDALRHVLITG